MRSNCVIETAEGDDQEPFPKGGNRFSSEKCHIYSQL
jgi:hypothetical protein